MSSQRDYFYPNTEPLAAGEMRITALGTGRPFVRRGQANCSWLIELGNGDKFVMDFGSGSQANFTALEIPHQDVAAYFATHLHADHITGLGALRDHTHCITVMGEMSKADVVSMRLSDGDQLTIEGLD